MLALAFHIGPDRFALPCGDIVEVVPRVALRAVPHAPPSIAGTFRYRGFVVPVVDLCQLVAGVVCPDRLSSRIVVTRFTGAAGAERRLGLLAERVLDTLALDPRAAEPTGIHVASAPYLGEVGFEGGTSVQLLRVDLLLRGPLRDLLFGSEEAT